MIYFFENPGPVDVQPGQLCLALGGQRIFCYSKALQPPEDRALRSSAAAVCRNKASATASRTARACQLSNLKCLPAFKSVPSVSAAQMMTIPSVPVPVASSWDTLLPCIRSRSTAVFGLRGSQQEFRHGAGGKRAVCDQKMLMVPSGMGQGAEPDSVRNAWSPAQSALTSAPPETAAVIWISPQHLVITTMLSRFAAVSRPVV